MIEGIIAVKKNDYSRGIGDLSWAIDHGADCGEARCFRGMAFMMKSQYDRALPDFDRATAACPERLGPWILGYRGQIYASKHDYNRAIDDLTLAIESQPSNVGLYQWRGYS